MIDQEQIIDGLTDYIRSLEKMEQDFRQRAPVILRKTKEAYERGILPVYTESREYAAEHGELEFYRASRRVNMACLEEIESAIRENFDGMHLKHTAAKPVLQNFSAYRVSLLLASTIRYKSWDGRFSRENRSWAEGIELPAAFLQADGSPRYVTDAHPAVLDGFIGLVRRELEDRSLQQKNDGMIIAEEMETEMTKTETETEEPDMNLDYKAFIQTMRNEVIEELSKRKIPCQVSVATMAYDGNSMLGAGIDYVMTLKAENGAAEPVESSFALNQFYEAHAIGVPMENIVSTALTSLQTEKLYDWSWAKDQVELGVVSYERDQDRLDTLLPHEKLGDICAFYRIPFGASEGDFGQAFKVTHALMEHWGVRRDELHRQALANTMAAHPLSFRSMGSVLGDLMGETVEDSVSMHILMTKDSIGGKATYPYGAAVLFYPEVKDAIEKANPGESAWIIPSSTHELICVTDTAAMSIREAEEMIQQVNRTQVAPEEFLSDHLYLYDAESRTIGMASDFVKNREESTPEKTQDEPAHRI